MIKMQELPNLRLLEDFIDYNPKTGIAFWKKNYSAKQRIGQEVGHYRRKDGYGRVQFMGKQYLLHRIFWLLYYKQDPWPIQIDHIDRDRSNNKIVNLRLVTPRQNALNRSLHSNNKLGVTGVMYNKRTKKFTAYIWANNKQNHLGSFVSLSDAVEARKKAEKSIRFNSY